MLRKLPSLFRIQYTSDLHLEMYPTLPAFDTFLKPCAPYLALAGDIGHPNQLKELFAWASPQWKHIFYVAGNHEYYGKTRYETRHAELIEVTKPYANIHFLHSANPSFYCEEENVCVIGSTLWTRVPIMSDWRSVSDFRCIKFKAAAAAAAASTFIELNLLHTSQQEMLDSEIAAWANRGAQLCVISHHMPSFQLIHPRFAMSTVNDCFASHSDRLLRPPVRLWIYGHTHATSHHVLKKTLCVCNARGYKDEHVAGWRPDVWMEFPTMDPQEVETTAKRDQTPLRLEPIEDDITFL